MMHEREQVVTRLVWRPWLLLFVEILLLGFLLSAFIVTLRPILPGLEWPLRIAWGVYSVARVNRMPATMLWARVYYTGEGWIAQDLWKTEVTGEGLTREEAIVDAKRLLAHDVLRRRS
jgi:hypothetical protein